MENTTNLTGHGEGPLAKGIEQQTTKLSSYLFSWAAVGSIGAALTLRATGHENKAIFVGQADWLKSLCACPLS